MLDSEFLASIARSCVYVGTVLAGGSQFVRWTLPQFDALGLRALRIQIYFGAALLLIIEPLRLASYQYAIAGGDLTSGLSATFLAMGTQMGPQQASLMRIFSTLAILGSVKRSVVVSRLAALALITSYLFEGHTVADDERTLSGVLLFIHLTIAHWWLAALYPMVEQLKMNDRGRIKEVVDRFSKLASYSVPVLLAAGGILLLLLLDGHVHLGQPYQQRFMLKILFVSVILAVAVRNKFWLTPLLSQANDKPARRMRVSILIEIAVAIGILLATAWTLRVGPQD